MQPARWRRVRTSEYNFSIGVGVAISTRWKPIADNVNDPFTEAGLRATKRASSSDSAVFASRGRWRPCQKNFQCVGSLSNDVSNCIDEIPWYLDRSPLTSMTFIPRRLTIAVLPTAIPCQRGNYASVLVEVEKIDFSTRAMALKPLS